VRLRVPLVALAACVALAGAASAEPVRVALLPVAVHSTDASSGYLSAGLASMLSSRLEQFDDVAVIRLDDAKPAASQPAAAIEAARAAGAEFVVFGSFTQFGNGASLDLQAARTQGADAGSARRMFVQAGALGDIIPKLGDVAGKIHLYVTGGHGEAASPAAAASPGGGASLADLTQRVEVLERAVFRTGPEEGPTPPPATKAPAKR